MVWVRRNDGVEFCTTEDSASYKLMMSDASFEVIDGPSSETSEENTQVETTPAGSGRRKKADK